MSDALWMPSSVSGQTTVLWSATYSGRRKREAETDRHIVDSGVSNITSRQGTSLGNLEESFITCSVFLFYIV